MSNKVIAFTLTPEQVAEYSQLLKRGDGFWVVGAEVYSFLLPPSLAKKIDSAVLIVSGSASDKPVVTFNFRRIDKGNIDEHPFGTMLLSGSIAVSSSQLDHGNWKGRTTKISTQHAAHISGSGIGDYFLSYPPNGIVSGTLDQLPQSDSGSLAQFIKSVIRPDV